MNPPNSGLGASKKAATLVLSLGTERAQNVLKHLSDDDVRMLASEVAELDQVDSTDYLAVLRETVDSAKGALALRAGGRDEARKLLATRRGLSEDELTHVGGSRPFSFLHEVETEHDNNHEDTRQQQPRVKCYSPCVLCLLQEHSPAHHRRPETKAEETETRLPQYHPGYPERQAHDEIAHETWKQVPCDDAHLGAPGNLCGKHVVLCLELKDLPANRARH